MTLAKSPVRLWQGLRTSTSSTSTCTSTCLVGRLPHSPLPSPFSWRPAAVAAAAGVGGSAVGVLRKGGLREGLRGGPPGLVVSSRSSSTTASSCSLTCAGGVRSLSLAAGTQGAGGGGTVGRSHCLSKPAGEVHGPGRLWRDVCQGSARRRGQVIGVRRVCSSSGVSGGGSGRAVLWPCAMAVGGVEVVAVEEQLPAASNSSPDWKAVLERVVPAVVVLRVTVTRAFDTEVASSSYATGFVVDKERGIILTNRHVVKPGPVMAEAMFLNREEVAVQPLYRDPVHDFGFFHYEPSALQFMEYDHIPLAPEAASVGLDVRVVGNDSGEKISILAGTLARLDRDAPAYADDGYNDFNTFYIQAASGTKGGSSGSPVVDALGRAVALNAGSKSSSSSAFFLPLDRVVRALHAIQTCFDEVAAAAADCPTVASDGGSGAEDADAPQNSNSKFKWKAPQISRGTLQTTFLHRGFEETRRLGLRRETEEEVRNATPATETGMLIVDSVVPGGPASGKLEPGDVIVKLNDKVLTQFLDLEVALDDSVGSDVQLTLERGGVPHTMALTVQDLHAITPSLFLSLSGGVIHPLSYQQARNFHLPCGAVYVADPGYMLWRAGVPRFAIITKVAGRATPNLPEFVRAVSRLEKGARVPLEYVTHVDRHRTKSVLMTVDRHDWYAAPSLFRRDDTSGLWTSTPAFSDPMLAEDGDADGGSVKEGGEQVAEELLGEQEMREDSARQQMEDGSGDVEGVANGVADGVDGDTAVGNNVEEEQEEAKAERPLVERALEAAFVMMEVHVPSIGMIDGVHTQHFAGTAVVVHLSPTLGLLVVDRNTVAVSMSDILLTFCAHPVEIPGEVAFLHPVHNFALVSFDPRQLPPPAAARVKAATLLPDPPLRRGEEVQLVGLSGDLQLTSRRSTVTNPTACLTVGAADSPRYRAMNMDVVEIDTDFGEAFSGVLSDNEGRIRALWGSFSSSVKYSDGSSEDHQFVRGIPIAVVSAVVDQIAAGCVGVPHSAVRVNGFDWCMPLVRVLEVELAPALLSKARSFGLPDKWVQALAKANPGRRQVLRVKGTLADSRASNVLEEGDMLVAIDSHPVTCFADVEAACNRLDRTATSAHAENAPQSSSETASLQAPTPAAAAAAAFAAEKAAGVADSADSDAPQPAAHGAEGLLNLTIFRQGKEVQVAVGTDVRDVFGTTRIVNWSGCLVQEPHPAVRALGFLPPQGHGAYVARWYSGSPAHRYGLYALHWIAEINGEPVPDLDALVRISQTLPHGAFLRVKAVQLNGKPKVLTLKTDLHYWPTWELSFDHSTSSWRRIVHSRPIVS